ncbi:MAG: hypothetical protein GX883_08325 [Firmicutes bacterium]|nr:hypothetical protein [Bacillota bacterium]
MTTDFDRMKPLTAADIQNIHAKTVDVLVGTGLWVESAAAREIYQKHGLKVDGEIVYFNEKVIEDAIKSAPEKFTVKARNPEFDLVVGGDSYAFAPSGGSPLFMEFSGEQRRATKEDCIDFLKITQYFDVLRFNRAVVSPSDIPSDNVSLWQLVSALKYTDKSVNAGDELTLELLLIAFGIDMDKLREDGRKGIYYGLGGINPVSPLSLTALQSDRLIFMAENYIPNIVATMPTAGMSAPCTIPGLLVTQNCENLGPIILSQLVNPGAPVIYGTIGTITDMKTGGAPIGVPEARIIEKASAQIARSYGIPTRGDCGLTDSLCCDFQAGVESALQFYNVIRSGIHLIPGCGELGSWMHGSLEKLVLDCEVAEYVTRIVRPLEVNEETMAVDVIEKVGPRGSYLTELHTLKNFRKEFYHPFLFNRGNYDNWAKEGRLEAKDRAHAKVEDILKNYERPALDRSLEKDIDKYVEANWPVK